MVRMRRALSSAPAFALTLASVVHAAPAAGQSSRGVHSEPSSPNNVVGFDQEHLWAGLANYLSSRLDDGENQDHTVYLTETYTAVSVSTAFLACSTDSESVAEISTLSLSHDGEPTDSTFGDDAERTGSLDAASRTTGTDGFVTVTDSTTHTAGTDLPAAQKRP